MSEFKVRDELRDEPEEFWAFDFEIHEMEEGK